MEGQFSYWNDTEIKKEKRNFYVTVSFHFFVFVIHFENGFLYVEAEFYWQKKFIFDLCFYQNWNYVLSFWWYCSSFFLFKIILSSLLMVVPSSSVNMERLKDGNVAMDVRVNIYARKWRVKLLLAIVSIKNLTVC